MKDPLLDELFDTHRDRLRRLIELRMDRRLHGRIDPSDVLQETWLDARSRAVDPSMPPYLWLRFLALQRLAALHRFHVGAARRSAGRERSLDHPLGTGPSTGGIARELAGTLTSPTGAAVRAEAQAALEARLEALDPADREILALRHFEELSNHEAAEILGISAAAASKRYIRALERVGRGLRDD